MSQQYRLIVHCDENLTDKCVGFTEYAATDRLHLAEQSDRFTAEGGWLRGYGAKNTYDVCPECKPLVVSRLAQGEAEPAPQGRNDG